MTGAEASLKESTRYCREVTRKAGTSFSLPFKTLPRSKRLGFEVVYAFMRICDDLSDDAVEEDRTDALVSWRTVLHQALDGDTSGHPVMPALMKVVDDFSIPTAYLDELIDGVEMDLTITRYTAFDDLYGYCYKVASVVGLVSLRLFGLQQPSEESWRTAEERAEACGIAFQLTNILRDIKEDLGRDRIYLPREDLDRFGLGDDDLRAEVLDERFLDFMRFQTARAQEYYDASEPLLAMLAPDARACLATMRAVYHGILEQIVGNDFDIWSVRARLSLARKLGIAARAFLGRFTS